MEKLLCTVEIQGAAHLGEQENIAQDAQKGRPLRPSFVSRISSFASIDFPACEIRFTRDASRDTVFALADFFSILLRAGLGLELLDHAVQAVLMRGGYRQKL